MFSGAAAGGTFFPLVGNALLQRVGYRATMITLAAIFGAANSVALLFIRCRIPVARVRSAPRRTFSYAFLKRRGMWTLSAFVALTAMGNFIPSLWMPSAFKYIAMFTERLC